MKRLLSVQHHSKNIDLALLIGRVVIACLMLTHGIPKLKGFNNDPIKFMNFLGMGPAVSLSLTVFAEVICSFLILIGFATRLAVIPTIITMTVVVFHVHLSDPFSKQELGLHFLLTYVMLLIMGSGRYSVDGLLFRKRYAI